MDCVQILLSTYALDKQAVAIYVLGPPFGVWGVGLASLGLIGFRVTSSRGESASVLPGLHYQRAVADGFGPDFFFFFLGGGGAFMGSVSRVFLS